MASQVAPPNTIAFARNTRVRRATDPNMVRMSPLADSLPTNSAASTPTISWLRLMPPKANDTESVVVPPGPMSFGARAEKSTPSSTSATAAAGMPTTLTRTDHSLIHSALVTDHSVTARLRRWRMTGGPASAVLLLWKPVMAFMSGRLFRSGGRVCALRVVLHSVLRESHKDPFERFLLRRELVELEAAIHQPPADDVALDPRDVEDVGAVAVARHLHAIGGEQLPEPVSVRSADEHLPFRPHSGELGGGHVGDEPATPDDDEVLRCEGHLAHEVR